MSGGKRFRAAFCYWGFRGRRSASPAEEESLVRAAAALELLHASALVHDDLMDASDTRRGRAGHAPRFEADHSAAGWPGRSRSSTAPPRPILLGDLLLSWSDELLRTAAASGAPRPPPPSTCSTPARSR